MLNANELSKKKSINDETSLRSITSVSVISSYGALSEDDADSDSMKSVSLITLKKIELATQISLLINIILFVIKIIVFIDTGSFAVIAALTDSFCDLVSQCILFYTQKAVRHQKPSFPAGRTRLEPIGILIMSILMIILSCFVVFASIFTLYNMYVIHSGFSVNYSLWSVMLLVVSIVLKFCLWLYCKQFKCSPTAMALAEDHRNDVLSNSTALLAVCIASQFHQAAWVDPAGGLVISLYIIYAWYTIGIEESNKLIGIEGSYQDINKIHEFLQSSLHIPTHQYILNGYYIGRNMLVECRLIYSSCTQYQKLCDLCVNLQRKLESFEFVERAFVNFDYTKRDKLVHKTPVLD